MQKISVETVRKTYADIDNKNSKPKSDEETKLPKTVAQQPSKMASRTTIPIGRIRKLFFQIYQDPRQN